MNRTALLEPHRRVSALILLVLGIAAPSLAEEKPVVVWYVLDFPPINIIRGSDKGKGGRDTAMRLVIERTPEFTHRIAYSNGPRALDALKNTPNACQPALMFTKERAKFAYYSISSDWALPNGIIIPAQRAAAFAPHLNTAGELQLEKLLTETAFRLGVNAGRSYGEEIDAILARHRERMVDIVSSNLLSSNLLKLATQSGFDAILGFPTELHYLIRTGVVPAEFRFLPIAEAKNMTLGEIGCSKSEEGRRFIAAFDRVLARPEVQAEIDAATLEWLPPDLRSYYQQRRSAQK